MLSRLPITTTAPLLIALPTLIVGVWLSLMWSHHSHTAVRDLANQNIEQIHDMAATKVADALGVPVQVCEVNGHLIRTGALPPAELAKWRPTLVEEARAFSMLSAISWGSADGRSVWVSRYADGFYYWAIKDDGAQPIMKEWRLDKENRIGEAPTNEFEFNLFSRPWYQAPMDAKKATWSKPFVWVGGVGSKPTLGIAYGIPIQTDDGEMLGVIDADYSLNDLSSFLQSLKIGKTGIAVLTTSDNKLLAVSNDAEIIEGDQRLDAAASADARIAAAAEYFSHGQRDGHQEMHVNGETVFLRASKVGEEVGLDWNLITIVPEQDFVAGIQAGARWSWLASFIAVAVSIGVGFAAARWLVAPLITLVSAVRKIGEGDLETRVNVQHAPEYTNLADEINEMTAGLQDRMRMRESLYLAMEVQKNLLPEDSPTIKGIDIAGHSTYCDETGGDYYDFLDLSGADDNTAVIAVGDVVGHGIAAAMLMATARGILRSRCCVPGSLSDFLDHLNSMLVVDTKGERFMTMLLLTISSSRNELRWASAGHGPPLVYNTRSNEFVHLDGGGLPLGLFEAAEYEEYTEPTDISGYIIVAATDGLWETMREDGTAFGMDRLRKLIRENADQPAETISNAIGSALTEFRGESGMDDDLTFVIAKVN